MTKKKKKELASVIKIKNFEMGRFSRIIWVGQSNLMSLSERGTFPSCGQRKT